MKFVVESWDPAYGSPVRDNDLDASTREVETGVEMDPDRWRPVTPGLDGSDAADRLEAVTFVDGVRRIDARLWVVEPDGRSRPAVCASVAAGAVRCRAEEARIVAVTVERGLYTASETARSIVGSGGGPAVHYGLRPVADDTDESLYLGVHTHMSSLEAGLADELSEPGMVVFDGPLGRRDGADAVGYVKTHHVNYLAEDLQTVVSDLVVGQRSPVFRINGRWPTWSWYLRLPAPLDHGMSGIVRLELPGLGDVEEAIDRADLVSACLPRFASQRHKDPRAPQNLYPIAGLERQLRRRLGDARLLERRLRRSAVSA